VKNGKGFWVYQFRDGNVIRSKGLGSAARVAHSRDGDQSFQAMVITDSSDRDHARQGAEH
jgi:hypothetical protein